MNNRSQFESVAFMCQICGHQWQPRKPIKPAECPKCRTPSWNIRKITKDDTTDIGSGASNNLIVQEITKKLLKRSENGSTITRELYELELEHALAQVHAALHSRDWEKMEEAINLLEYAVKRMIESGSSSENRTMFEE